MKQLVLTLISFISVIACKATTWDEPWRKEIIQQSEYWIRGVVTAASDSAVVVEIQQSFGNDITGTITLDDFFLLDLCSYSGGHGPEFHFKIGQEGYFFLQKGENGLYQLPTPTSGFDALADDQVHATYRHSYHQAAIPVAIYELTYQSIWNKYRNKEFNLEQISNWINDNLSAEPAGFDEEEIPLFFRQHAALETAYLLDISLDIEVLIKFASSDNFHSRVSAIRAMYHLQNDQVKTFLLGYLMDKKQDNFTKVIAIWTLWKMDDPNVQKRLWKIRKKLSEEENGFGGNIMDPRVCTHFPSPKVAIIELKESDLFAKSIWKK